MQPQRCAKNSRAQGKAPLAQVLPGPDRLSHQECVPLIRDGQRRSARRGPTGRPRLARFFANPEAATRAGGAAWPRTVHASSHVSPRSFSTCGKASSMSVATMDRAAWRWQ